jgi:hypothetical protein
MNRATISDTGLRLSQQKRGPHRSATPKDLQMNTTRLAAVSQPAFGFLREGLVTLNPAQANMILRELPYEHQRDLTRAKSHIATLAEQMSRKLWLSKTQIDFARVGDRLILVNGHHRMAAQVQAAANILWNITFHDCADMTAVANLYWRFDTTLRKRSASNILTGLGFAEEHGLSATIASALWGAAPIIANGMRFSVYQNGTAALLIDDRQAVAQRFVPQAMQMQEFIAAANPAVRQRLRVSSRFAVALVTLHYQPTLAVPFWQGLCADDGLAKNDPRKALLNDMQVRNGKMGAAAASMMAVARSWNAFFSDERLALVRVGTSSSVKIAGTPFTVRA